ncbi:MAG: HAD family phosphatase [Oscillospiraceae bacterium]|nr:HAD family phosphatase [Oscillospiraceae bacterium]
MAFDFSEFLPLEQTADGVFRSGKNGVDRILTPADQKSEFIFMGESIFVRLKSAVSGPVMYQLKKPEFQPKAEAVLMDLDGTSVQSEEFWIWIIQRTMQQLMGKNDFLLEKEDIPFVSGFSVSEHLQYCIQKYAPEEKLEQARKLYHQITAYEMDEILKGRGNQQAFRPTPHLKEFLYTLKKEGIKIGLVTSGLYVKAMPEIVAAFRTLDMGDPIEFYDAIITAGSTYIQGKQSGTLGELCAKPHPWLYAETAQVGLNITPDSTRVIGIEDSSAGVLSVALAGYPVVGVSGGNIHDAGLDGLLYQKTDHLLDILEWIL